MTTRQVFITLALACLAGVAAADPAAIRAAVEAAEPGVATAPSTPPPAKRAKDKSAPPAIDRLELERTQITGNAELPKVMVVVPWKRADIGELAGRPLNSLVDEALQPVDREVFRREIDYYRALAPDAQKGEKQVTGAPPSGQPEK